MHTKIIEIGNHLIPEASTAYAAALIETFGKQSIIEVFHNPNHDIRDGLAHYALGNSGWDDPVVVVNESVYSKDLQDGLFKIEDLNVPDYEPRKLRYVIEVGVGIREPREHDDYWGD